MSSPAKVSAAVLLIGNLVFASATALQSSAARETLLWLKEKESFHAKSCRLAMRKDVRALRINTLGDVMLDGETVGQPGVNEINITYYVKLRYAETGADTLGSRLGRMGLALSDVPIDSCAAWSPLLHSHSK